MACTFRWEKMARAKGALAPAGIDEAGRGCLFGPVTAAAVILPEGCRIRNLRDSKEIGAAEREDLGWQIRAEAVAWAVGWASVSEIARLNIREAARLAMRRAVEGLKPTPDYLLIDAMRIEWDLPQEAIVGGDRVCRSIAAASIVAKTERDRLMERFHIRYPEYGLAAHKGYGTAAHLAALRRHGPTPQHRATFGPVREIIEGLG